MTDQVNRTLWVQIPENLYDHILAHAREQDIQLERIIWSRVDRKRRQIVWPKYMAAAALADSVRQTVDHTDIEDLQPFFDDWPGEEGWHLIAHILADEVDKLSKLHCQVIAAIRSGKGREP